MLLTESWSPRHIAKIKILWAHWPYSYLQYAGYRAYQASKRAAHFFISLQEKIEGMQSAGLRLHTSPRHFTRGL
jgi:hypothetical protein